MKAKFYMAALFRYSEIGARMPLKPYSGRSVTSIINIFQLITEAHSQSLSAQQQGGQWNALVDGANGSIMETVKISLKWYRKTNIAEVLSIWLGKRESLKGFWADGLAHLAIFFFNMAVGCYPPSLCSGMCWPRSIQPRPDTGDWAVGRKALGLVWCVSPTLNLCGIQGRVHCLILGTWGSYKKQHFKGLLGPSLVCRLSGIPWRKGKEREGKTSDVTTAFSTGLQQSVQKGSRGLWPHKAQCSSSQHMPYPQISSPYWGVTSV